MGGGSEVGKNIKVGVLGGSFVSLRPHQILTKCLISGSPIRLLTPYIKMILLFSHNVVNLRT